MKSILSVAVLLAFSNFARASDSHLADKLRSDVALQIQTYPVSADGKRLLIEPFDHALFDKDSKLGDLSHTWMARPKDLPRVNLDFLLKIADDTSMTLTVTEYAKAEYDPASGQTKKEGRGRTEKFDILNFQPVIWITKVDAEKSLVTRFTPYVVDHSDSLKLSYTPMALTDVIVSDNGGKVWLEGVSALGEVVKLVSLKGTLYMSFTEFKGSIELGKAGGQLMELTLSDSEKVRIRSAKAILGEGFKAKVFGVYLPKLKAPGSASYVGAFKATQAEKELVAEAK